MRKLFVLLMLLASVVSLTGCYINKQVEASEAGLRLNDGVTVFDVVSSGRYTNWGLFSELVEVDVSAKTSTWTDPDLVTSDKQPIGLEVTLTYQRMRSGESVEAAWKTYRAELVDDEALKLQVLTRIPGVAKDITAGRTLNSMLGIGEDAAGRRATTDALSKLLEPELAEVYVRLLDVRISNISVDQDYLDGLSEKALAQVQREIAAERTILLRETLEQERAQTDIDLEVARRQNLVNEELAKVYEASPEYLSLKKLETLAEIFDETDKVIFVPEGSDLSVLTGLEGVVPVR